MIFRDSKGMATANPSSKNVGTLTMDKAAFLLIRIKKAFLKKRNKGKSSAEKPGSKKKPPLLRARTLPAIICPSLNIIQAQLEASSVASTADDEDEFQPRPRRYPSGSIGSRGRPSQDQGKSYLDPDIDLSKSPLGSPRPSLTSVTSVTSSTSQQSSGRESTKQKNESTRAGLAKLARLLTSKEKTSNDKNMHHFTPSIPNIEVTPLRRSGSVDSLLDVTGNSYHLDVSDISNCSSMACLAPACSANNLSGSGTLTVPTDGRTIPTSPSVPAKLEAHRRDLPLSPSVPNRLAKGQCLGSREVLLEGLQLSKTERKRLEKLNKINIDLQALFVSVEHEHLERARSILMSTDVNVNCVNGDGFTPLDIAVMTLDISMAKLLQSYGARESTRFRTKESRFSQLLNLVKEAERCVEDLTSCVLSAAASGSISMALLKEKEKQLTLWKRRQQLLWRMKSGFEKIKPPESPTSVQLEVVGVKSLKVKFSEPESSNMPEAAVTKYRVEWSCYEDFRPLSGAREMMNLQRLELTISELTHGMQYHVRVAAGNSKGYSEFRNSTPPAATPSSWMDVDCRKSRSMGRVRQLDCLFHQIIFSRPPCSSEIKDLLFCHSMETPQQQRRQVRKSIKNLFASTPKFQKTMKRGVYLACLLYSDHRVLVTTDDILPIMEVDENCPSCLHNDFHWLMKVACTWEDSKALRTEMEKSHSSSAVHFRGKLLQAAEMMQAALGVQDLGQFYYKPLKDADDTTVLCTVKCVADPKSLNNLSLRWMPLAKLQRKLSFNIDMNVEMSTVNNLLLSSMQDMMTYNLVSHIALPRGLYVAYVKISCSVELIRVMVPRKAPNVLPYYRVRENPHVSSEEWGWIKSHCCSEKTVPSDAQLKFQKSLSSAARNLLTLLEISPDHADGHRIYDPEIVELNPEVSLILLLPPVENVCSVPGQKDDVTDRDDCILLPLQIFEMIHMGTYQHTFISRYSRISSILEMDTIVANHIHRQAFSTTELSSAKSRLRQLQEFQTHVDNTWRAMRWIMDVINFAREKQPPGGIPLSTIWVQKAGSPSPVVSPLQSPLRHTLQVPVDLSRQDAADPITIRITNSTSSFSLTEATEHLPEPASEMRRCASTSGLLQVAIGEIPEKLNLPPTGMEDRSKAYSVEGLSVTFKVDGAGGGSSYSSTVSDEKDDKDYEDDERLNEKEDLVEQDEEEDEAASQDGIIINVAGSNRSLSSNDATLPEVDEEDEEEEIKPHDKTKDNTEDISDDESTDEGGLQFKDIPCVSDDDDEANDMQFFLNHRKCPSSAREPSTSAGIWTPPSESHPSKLGLLQVYAAYDSGLPSGTSVRLHVSPDTSVREIVDTVVKQVNTAVVLKGKHRPIYSSSKELAGFCLVALMDSTERCLSDSFQPLKVQNPWTKGKLLVRRKSDLCGSTSDI